MTEKKPSLKEILTFSVFILVIGAFSILNRIITPPEISQAERRPLQTMPSFSFSSFESGEFTDKFEDYAADSFVFRDTFRAIRAFTVFDIFRQTDKSGLYLGEAGAGKFEKLNESALRQTAGKIRAMAGELYGLNTYYSFIPDKSVYDGRELPGFDADEARRILGEELPGIKFIDLTNALRAEDYYRTDLHWDQLRLGAVTGALGEAMSFAPPALEAFSENRLSGFEGVYAGQLALPMEPDDMTYLTGDFLNGVSVSYLNAAGELAVGEMYDIDAFYGRDPYDLFLGGVQPLIVIDNPNAGTERELYLFRDSFSSSLAPLLAPIYARITLIDLRYINSRVLSNYIEFKPGADALFLYGSQILNNPSVLLYMAP
jgi:hypothetical protein